MKVFLTGGTGYLGGHVARAFLAAGHQVEALVRDRDRALDLRDHGASLVEGDVTAPETWRDPMQRAEVFVHAAATVLSWAEDPTVFKRVNVDGALRMVDHAADCGVSRILVASSLFVMFLLVGFSLVLGFPKLRKAGGKTLIVRSLEEGMGGAAVFLPPNAPRGPTDQLHTPELKEIVAAKAP